MRTKALILLWCVVLLSGLVGCAETGKVVKQEEPALAPTLQILQLSDLHIGKSLTVERDNLIAIVGKIVGKWGGAENKPLVMITGDLSNGGEVDEFEQARTILDPLYRHGFKMLVIPGNHDYGPVGNWVQVHRFGTFKKRFYGTEAVDFPLQDKINGHVLIGLNSMEGHEHDIDFVFADGKLGQGQINRTAEILDGLQGRDKKKQKVIVYLHHHPFLYPGQGAAWNVEEVFGHWLDDGHKLKKEISGRVDILLFGHEHWHLDFTGTEFASDYGVPIILSAGMSTDEGQYEYKVDQKGVKDESGVLNRGLLGRLISIQDDGSVKVETIKF